MERNLTKKEERIREKERLSAVVTNKMTIVFLSLVFAIIALVRLSSNATSEIGFVMALPYIQLAFLLLTAAALAWEIVSFKRGTNARFVTFSAPLLLGISASGLFASLLYTSLGGTFRTVLCLIAFALLFFVYQIYSVDFFACSVAAVTGGIAAAIVTSAGFTVYTAPVAYTFAILMSAAASAVGALFVYRLNRDGKVELFGRRIKKPQSCAPAAIYTVMAVSFAAALVALIFGHLLYCIAAIAVVYFVVAIIYTAKLM